MKALTKEDLINIIKERINIGHEMTKKMQQLVNNLYDTVDSSPDNKVEDIKLPWHSCMWTLYENQFQEYVSFSKYIERIMGDVRLGQIKNYNIYMDTLFPQKKKTNRKTKVNKGE